jgi:hypothetical protein
MTISIEAGTPSRRAAMVRARQSRRPSRLGTAAGSAPGPDRILSEDAGFREVLTRVWRRATHAPDLAEAVDILLTLDGLVPAGTQLRALRLAEECALRVLFGRSWRGRYFKPPGCGESRPHFNGAIGLTTGGRVALAVPGQGAIAEDEDLVDGILRVPWSAEELAAYQRELSVATARFSDSVLQCRRWLSSAGARGRDVLLEELTEAALRTAPFTLYQEGRRYTNFRDRNNLPGKTLWRDHPDCVFTELRNVPLDLWSDSDATMVVCLSLLVSSGGFARIEEANGTQLSLDHVGDLLDRIRRMYNEIPCGHPIAPAVSGLVDDLRELADALRSRRQELGKTVRLYRAIHGALMHKTERIARFQDVTRTEAAICERLAERLPVAGGSLAELSEHIAGEPGWLARPHGTFDTGLESLVFETVSAAQREFSADFAMSRGIRSLPRLVAALREQAWEEITRWELPEYFCCVVPAVQAVQLFEGSPELLADITWSISARMQYNSWHFIAGNLPMVPAVTARDHFVPPTIPDIAYHSDLHHHGHVAANVRFSIRSPQAVDVLGRTFKGFVDLRLLRCDGVPFSESDLLAADRASAFIAAATGRAADLAASGEAIEVTAFDSAWHLALITGERIATS